MQERERNNNCLRANNKFSVSEDLQTSNDKAANYFHEVAMTTHGAIATRVRYYCSPLGFGVWVADFFLQLRAKPNKIPSGDSWKRKRGFTSWFSMEKHCDDRPRRRKRIWTRDLRLSRDFSDRSRRQRGSKDPRYTASHSIFDF